MFMEVLLLASSGKSSSFDVAHMLSEGAPSSSGTDNKWYQHQNYNHVSRVGSILGPHPFNETGRTFLGGNW